jgi:hypothetical protein
MKLHPFESAFEITCYSWKLPLSNTYIPLVNIAGKPSPVDDPRVVTFHTELLPPYCSREILIADVSTLKARDEVKIGVLEELASRYDKVVYVNSDMLIDDRTYVLDNRNEDFVFCPTRENAIADAAVLMKNTRFDGGKEWVSDLKSLDYSLSPAVPEKGQLGFSFERLGDEVLLISVSGIYPKGSAGAAEGKMLELMLNYAYRLVGHPVLIVDMRKLDYTSGAGWNYAPFNVRLDKKHPFRLIISKEQETHMRGQMGKENRISRSLKEACEALNLDSRGIRG